MLSQLGGTKFIYALFVVLLCFGLVIAGKLTSDAFTSFAEVIGGIYVIGNVAATVANGMTGQNQQTTSPSQNQNLT